MSQGFARLCLASALVLLGACASGPKPGDISAMPPSGIHLGNEIPLLDAPPEKTVAHMTPDGRVHVAAIMDSGEAVHLVVSERGVEHREKIGPQRYGYYDNLAIADDAEGRLHLALKNEHWILEKGAWRLAGDNRCALLARAGDALACACDVDGKELQTSAQWGASLIGGGFGSGLIIPYRYRPDKLVVAKAVGDGWSWRGVLDHGATYGVNLTNVDSGVLAGDASGRFHLLFIAHEENHYGVRYHALRFDGDGAQDIEWRQPEGPSVMLGSRESEPARPGPGAIIPWSMLALAVDPQTGTAMFFSRRIGKGFGDTSDASVEIRDGVFGDPVPIPVRHGSPRRLAPAGKEGFHALVTVRPGLAYAAYRAGAWSAPTRIGEYGTPSLFLIGDSSIQIASDGRREALAIWPTRTGGLAGRWIRLDETPN